jgi:2-aminoadipate transaminase
MRDLMAITERPEVISLAGGLPDTSTFPADTYAALMHRVAEESCARALQYGPTEGLGVSRAAWPRSWRRRGRSSTPTTC